jgi:IS1 family transposase
MRIPEDKALLAIQLLVEGTSIRSTERITEMHRDTILRLLVLAGERCIALMDTQMRNLRCERIQSDELWGYIFKKQRNVKVDDPDEYGNVWTFVAIDPDTKLIPCYVVGKRDRETTYRFLNDLRGRIAEEHRFQLSTDGFVFYRSGVEDVFAGQTDFCQVIKLFGDYGQHDSEGRYSPAPMVETIIKVRDGRPDLRHASTSIIERQNLHMRQAIRRLTRLTLGFSKKLDNFKAACALHFAYYNWCKIHSSLRCTPAMESQITDHIWTLRELLS